MKQGFAKENSIGTQLLITFILVAVTFMEFFDTTIVNVALPDMMSSFEVGYQEITWVVTSYIVGTAMFMPLTGFFVKTVGHKKTLLISIIGFMTFSIGCGLSSTLTQIAISRFFQGICGANLVSLSQYLLATMFEGKAYNRALSSWTIAISIAPFLGVFLGGYIVQHFSWPMIFFINIPVCVIAVVGTMTLISESKNITKEKIDVLGLLMMFFCIGLLQLILDKGNMLGWYGSERVAVGTVWVIVTFIIFLFRGLGNSNYFINFAFFKNRQSLLCLGLIFLYSITVLSNSVLLSLLLQTTYLLTSETVGLIYLPDCFALVISMGLTSFLLTRVDVRILMTIGIFISVIGYRYLAALSPNFSAAQIIISEMLISFGNGFVFLTVVTTMLSGLSDSEKADASGLFNLVRSIGSSVGVSISIIMLTDFVNRNVRFLSAFVQPSGPQLKFWLSQQQFFQHGDLSDPLLSFILNHEVYHQSMLLSFNHIFLFIAFLNVLCLPFVFLLSAPKTISSPILE